MNPRKPRQKATTECKPLTTRLLRIVRLEPRIAPKLAVNHNATLVRLPAKPKLQTTRKLRIVKLEPCITPTPSIPIPPP